MPIHILASAITQGPEAIPGWPYIKTYAPILATVASLKYYFGGAANTWERNLHSQVYIVTGGTSGLGASVVDELASRGAQVVLLVRSLKDDWLVDHIDSLREKHGNLLVYAEECDLNSLHSVRKFATSWLDNQGPRRLDGIILCAGESLPMGKPRQLSVDGVERQIAINYLANFHLLTLLAPAVRSQPSDRKVKVLAATCLSQVFGSVDLSDLLWEERKYPVKAPWRVFGTSKLLLGCFIKEYQRRMDVYERSDKTPMCVRANLVNPGIMRSPSTKRFLSLGSIIGLFFYLLLYPILWIFFKSTYQGAQNFMFGLNNGNLDVHPGGNFIQECSVVQKNTKKELNDAQLQKQIYDKTEKLIASIEKNSAIQRKKLEHLANKKSKKDKKGAKKGVPEEKPKDSKAEEENRQSFLKQSAKDAKLLEELAKMNKGMPLLGDKPVTRQRENRHFKSLDAKYEASRKKAEANKSNKDAIESSVAVSSAVSTAGSQPAKKSRKT